jgi:hypothetical protein
MEIACAGPVSVHLAGIMTQIKSSKTAAVVLRHVLQIVVIMVSASALHVSVSPDGRVMTVLVIFLWRAIRIRP